MAKAKLAITLDSELLNDIDELVPEHQFKNRSQAIEAAVAEKVARLARTRLARESAKLDPRTEKAHAEAGLSMGCRLMARVLRAQVAVFATGLLLGAFHRLDLSAQQPAAVTIRVEQQGTGMPVDGATVRLTGNPPRVTNRNGHAYLTGVAPGRYTLAVTAIGHAPVEQIVDIRADTTLVIAMRPVITRLDTVRVKPRTFRLIAEVLGRDNRRPLPGAEIRLAGKDERTDGWGILEVRRLSTSDSLLIEILAPGYLPKAVPLYAIRDTTMRILLDPDPIGQLMIKRQLERVYARVNGMPEVVRRFTREDMTGTSAATIGDRLRGLGVDISRLSCLVIDDQEKYIPPSPPRSRSGLDASAAVDYLNRYAPAEIEAIQIVGRTRLRVYTYNYVRRVLPGIKDLPAVSTRFCS